MRRWLFILWLTTGLAGAMAVPTRAQSTTLSGFVTDVATGKPIPFVNVYLNTTTRGTVTNDRGYFSLAAVPLGTVEVVASFVGYKTERRTLRLDTDQPQTVNFRLKPDDQLLATVTVKASRSDKTWQRNFRRFKQQLLGEPFVGQCEILNSHVLTFTDEKGHLKASVTEPLLIENQALGYRLWYDLLYFDATTQEVYYAGTARFEEIKPTDERQAGRFRRNRMKAYSGSTRHLMASLVAGTYEQEGFLVYQENITAPIASGTEPATLQGALNRRLLPLKLNQLILPGRLPFERQLVSNLPVVVFYTGAASTYSPYRDARYAYSHILLPNRAMQFTIDGWISAPNGMQIQGSLSEDRLSRLLPADWHPSRPGDIDAPTGTPANEPIATQGRLVPPDARLGRISNTFNEQFRTLGPSLFVHTDKPLYMTGDRMWLSAYLLDAATSRRPIGETAIHVDLLTPSGRLVQHQWLHITDGRATGNFRLSDSLSSGQYQLRAYTDEDNHQHRPAFERTISVYNLLLGSATGGSDTSRQSLDSQFLPEGGRWIAGLPARLGIKLIGPDGRGRAATGRIVDSAGVEVARFVSHSLGMASVNLTPQSGRKYYAEVLYKGQTQLTSLPPTESEGLVFSVDAVSDSTRLGLSIYGTSRAKLDSVYVLIQQRGRLVKQQKIILDNGVARVSLPTAVLPAGLNQITLYDASARPRAERLVLIPESLPPVHVKMSANKPRYQPRERVMLNMTLVDDDQSAVAALSASITDVGQVASDTAMADMRTHLLLTGELRGRVEQPNVYFANNSLQTRKALDDLLLTQGWRRISGTPDTELLGGVSVIGRVVNAKNQPMAGAQVILASTVTGQSFVRSAGADEQGRFRIAGLAIADTIQLLAQLTDRQFKDIPEKDAQLILERPGMVWKPDTIDLQPNWTAIQAQLDAARVRQEADRDLYRDKTVKLLKEVTVRARKIDERPEDIRRMSLHSGADATIVFDDNSPRFANLYEMLRGRASGVSVNMTEDGSGYKVLVRGIGTIQSGTEPLFLMDGVPVVGGEEGTTLLSFNPIDIERIEVLKNASSAGIYGVRAANGVIAFYSKRSRPGQGNTKAKAGMKSMQMIGFPSVQREFYVPRYDASPDGVTPDSSAGKPERHIDRRDVLYWKPLIQTDGQGRATLAFPLSDIVRTIRVTVQGITADGRPVASVQLIQVQ